MRFVWQIKKYTKLDVFRLQVQGIPCKESNGCLYYEYNYCVPMEYDVFPDMRAVDGQFRAVSERKTLDEIIAEYEL